MWEKKARTLSTSSSPSLPLSTQTSRFKSSHDSQVLTIPSTFLLTLFSVHCRQWKTTCSPVSFASPHFLHFGDSAFPSRNFQVWRSPLLVRSWEYLVAECRSHPATHSTSSAMRFSFLISLVACLTPPSVLHWSCRGLGRGWNDDSEAGRHSDKVQWWRQRVMDYRERYGLITCWYYEKENR